MKNSKKLLMINVEFVTKVLSYLPWRFESIHIAIRNFTEELVFQHDNQFDEIQRTESVKNIKCIIYLLVAKLTNPIVLDNVDQLYVILEMKHKKIPVGSF